MKFWLVKIQDKKLSAEPDIGFAIIMARDEHHAIFHHAVQEQIEALRLAGRDRCVAHAREIELHQFYRTLALVRPPMMQVGHDGDDGKLT